MRLVLSLLFVLTLALTQSGCLTPPQSFPTTQAAIEARTKQVQEIRAGFDVAREDVDVLCQHQLLSADQCNTFNDTIQTVEPLLDQLADAAEQNRDVDYNSLLLQIQPKLLSLYLDIAVQRKSQPQPLSLQVQPRSN